MKLPDFVPQLLALRHEMKSEKDTGYKLLELLLQLFLSPTCEMTVAGHRSIE